MSTEGGEAWTAELDDIAFGEWTAGRIALAQDAWCEGDRDRFFSISSPAVVYRTHRALGPNAATGAAALDQMWAIHDLLPRLEMRAVTTVRPDRAIVRMTFSDHDENELIVLAAIRVEAGLIVEFVTFDEADASDARAQLDRWPAA